MNVHTVIIIIIVEGGGVKRTIPPSLLHFIPALLLRKSEIRIGNRKVVGKSEDKTRNSEIGNRKFVKK